LVRAAAQRGVRFSKAISYGNACDIDESDLLEYFIQDSETGIVAAYIEGVKDGRRFYRVLKKLSKVKPVVVLKAGYTQAGAGAAASHTGALAGSDEVWGSLLQQAGAIRVYTLEELVDMVVTLLFLPLPKGRRVGIFGGGGGASVLATDECTTAGFVVSPLPPQIREEIDKALRSFLKSDAGMILNNPLDLTPLASSEGLYKVIRRLSTYEEFDLLVAQNVISASGWPYPDSPFGIWTALFADAVIKTHNETGKPTAVVLHHIVSSWDLQRALELQQRYCEAGLPVYHSIANAAEAINRFMCYHEKRLAATKGG